MNENSSPKPDAEAGACASQPWDALDLLWQRLQVRAGGDPATSYTARLVAAGPAAIGRKLVEESTEALVAALSEGRARTCDESADVLYHLLALWIQQGIEPREVINELMRRSGQSGLEERAARKAAATGKT